MGQTTQPQRVSEHSFGAMYCGSACWHEKSPYPHLSEQYPQLGESKLHASKRESAGCTGRAITLYPSCSPFPVFLRLFFWLLPKINARDILPPRFDLFIFPYFMAQVCTICESKPQVGNMRSHSNRATKRRWNINLQRATVNGKQIRVCASCLKTLAKNAK